MQLSKRILLRTNLCATYRPTTPLNRPRPASTTSRPKPPTNPPPPDGATSHLSKWSTSLQTSTLIEILIPSQKPLQVQSALLLHTTHPTKSRLKISWPREGPMQPEFLSQPTLDLKAFPPAAGLTFLFWLYNRYLPHLEAHLSLGKHASSNHQELFHDLLTQTWLLGAALGAPAFQNAVMRALAHALEKEEVEAARSCAPHYSNAIFWARRTWDAARGREEGRVLRDFAVDVAARRVWVVGSGVLVLSEGERRELGGEGFAGEVFGSLGGMIGIGGVGIRELGRVGLVEER